MTSLAIVLLNSADNFADKAVEYIFGAAFVVFVAFMALRFLKDAWSTFFD